MDKCRCRVIVIINQAVEIFGVNVRQMLFIKFMPRCGCHCIPHFLVCEFRLLFCFDAIRLPSLYPDISLCFRQRCTATIRAKQATGLPDK